MLAASALGLYSLLRQIVFQIQGLVNPIITRVGFPLIAQLQAAIPKVRAIYLKTLNMTAATNAPLYVGMAFFAPVLVRPICKAGLLEYTIAALRPLLVGSRPKSSVGSTAGLWRKWPPPSMMVGGEN